MNLGCPIGYLLSSVISTLKKKKIKMLFPLDVLKINVNLPVGHFLQNYQNHYVSDNKNQCSNMDPILIILIFLEIYSEMNVLENYPD